MNYQPPLKDMQFLLNEVFRAETLWQSMPRTAELTQELADSILEEAARITETLIAPINRAGDEEGVAWSASGVTTPKGYKEAWDTYVQSGWVGLGGNPEHGGQGMPKMLTVLFEEMLHASSNAFALYSILTSGAALALDAHGPDELKSFYLPKMYSGEWAGVMCLTESHAGSDLGIIRTKAESNDDGSYCLNGTKIFITGGEQDLTDNIIHLVLAKLPDAPPGPKGISLFLVPKLLPNADGSLGDANGVSCGSTEDKMGIHASATCVMNFDDAKGWLVGDLNRGLNCMFTMMNYERLSVGIQGLGCSTVSYQNSLVYAKDRLQGRSPAGKQNADGIADPLIVHGDVRRMLLTQKAFIEAGRAFALFVGQQLDMAKYAEGDVKDNAAKLVALLTPVTKAFMTDVGFESCVAGQQIFGGHGYIREWGMEQMVRDVRIAQIYEGTNGIQAMDLINRKVLANDGQWLTDLLNDIATEVQQDKSEALSDMRVMILESLETLHQLSDWLLSQGKDDVHLAGVSAVEFLHVVGYVMYAWMWHRMAVVAETKDDEWHQSKILTANFYCERLLPRIHSLVEVIQNGSSSVNAMSVEQF